MKDMNEKIELAKRLYQGLDRWKYSKDAILSYIKNNRLNTSIEPILIKVVLINILYGTNVRVHPVDIAQHIKDITNIDELINKANPNAISLIADYKDMKGKKKDYLSFASKYCFFHNDKFVIYDKNIAHFILKKYFNWKDHRKYDEYFNRIIQLKKDFSVDNITNLDLDKYLWLAGAYEKIKIHNNKGDDLDKIKDVSKEVVILYKNNQKEFEKLDFKDLIE